jgi:hypothetical protein
MNDSPTPRRKGARSTARTLALVAGGVLAGGVVAGAGSALAAGSDTSTSGTGAATSYQGAGSGTATTPQGQGRGQGPQAGRFHGADPVRGDEKKLTGTDADKVRAAALKAVPGGTVYRVETDAGDGAYEAHLTKSDGTEVTVKLDKSFTVAGIEDGMGKGDPAPGGRAGGTPPPGATARGAGAAPRAAVRPGR